MAAPKIEKLKTWSSDLRKESTEARVQSKRSNRLLANVPTRHAHLDIILGPFWCYMFIKFLKNN